tara:strand:+ start:2606 stop:2890 length:285 start_codon:yes stop_codon:yes gene_type:complete
MGKVKAQLDDRPLEFGDEGIPEWKMKRDMDRAYKEGQRILRNNAKIVEIEYWSECCDAPPMNYEKVASCEYDLEYCQKCGMGSKFYIKKGKSNE